MEPLELRVRRAAKARGKRFVRMAVTVMLFLFLKRAGQPKMKVLALGTELLTG